MPNKWIEHVKKFSRENNMSYGCAISDPRCKSSYKQPETKQPTFKQPTFKQIQENRKIEDKKARERSAKTRREVRKMLYSQSEKMTEEEKKKYADMDANVKPYIVKLKKKNQA